VAGAQGRVDPLGDLGGARMQRAEAAGRRVAPPSLNRSYRTATTTVRRRKITQAYEPASGLRLVRKR
jgi:hypothetical protein